jgi:hypothetical protein
MQVCTKHTTLLWGTPAGDGGRGLRLRVYTEWRALELVLWQNQSYSNVDIRNDRQHRCVVW